MPLVSGTKLGPYEIQSPLGAGGMGEVYRARDTRLQRSVAIKILPAQLSNDPARKQRLEREAKTISSLNHPNICVLHDIGSQDGVDYLVMECVEGETLALRLEKGPLPLEQVLKCGAQIADALDKAHRSGVVHRDLKPGNIMLTPTGAKLLDFGLAKPAVPLVSGATLSATLTPTTPVTQEGMVVGTFQYMSPEQLEGKEVDGRSDIFSLGAIVYEMVTGKRAFEGKSQLSVASAILEKEPAPISTIKPMTPPALDHVIRKCLAKTPEDRWQSAADIKHELAWISQASADGLPGLAGRSKKSFWVRAPILTLGALLLVTLGVLVDYLRTGRETSGPVVRATLVPPPNINVLTLGDEAGAPAISRDGSHVVFVGKQEGKQMLFLWPLDSATPKPLPGTEGAKFPFWSSDEKSIGFFADQQLKRLDLSGGPPMSLAPAPDGRGGTWTGDVILFAPYIYEVIYRVPASGGEEVPVTTLDRSQHTTHRWPRFLPDGKHFLYLAAHHMSSKEENSGIYAASIDGGSPKFILRTKGAAFYSSGELLYFRDGSLMAQEFDKDRLELRGDARPIDPVLREGGNWGVIASASENGVLLFQSSGEVKYPIFWFDRSGRRLGPAPISGELKDLRLSPDGTRVVANFAEGPTNDLSVCDFKGGTRTRLTFGENIWSVAWSPDGRRVVYSAEKAGTGGKTEVYLKSPNGSEERELLLSSGNIDHPTDWTRDGRYIVIHRGEIGSRRIWAVPLVGDRKAFPIFPNAAYDHFDGRTSADGKWIAYQSAESGHLQLYVTSFPGGIGKWQISTEAAASAPVWREDGKELYFVTQAGNLMVASVQEFAGSIAIGDVRPLFWSPFLTSTLGIPFDVDPKDGQRFIGSAAPDTTSLPLNVITNWTAKLKKN